MAATIAQRLAELGSSCRHRRHLRPTTYQPGSAATSWSSRANCRWRAAGCATRASSAAASASRTGRPRPASARSTFWPRSRRPAAISTGWPPASGSAASSLARPISRITPRCINGASDLMVAVLGDAGRHARAAVGVASLPFDAAVEVEGMFELALRRPGHGPPPRPDPHGHRHRRDRGGGLGPAGARRQPFPAPRLPRTRWRPAARSASRPAGSPST